MCIYTVHAELTTSKREEKASERTLSSCSRSRQLGARLYSWQKPPAQFFWSGTKANRRSWRYKSFRALNFFFLVSERLIFSSSETFCCIFIEIDRKYLTERKERASGGGGVMKRVAGAHGKGGERRAKASSPEKRNTSRATSAKCSMVGPFFSSPLFSGWIFPIGARRILSES